MSSMTQTLLLAAGMLFASPFAASAPTNVAPAGTATQSSNYNDSVLASRAIDGNTDGSFYHNSVQHTLNDENNYVGNGYAWWQVALGQDYQVDQIVIWNRTDCCVDRLNNFTVTLFDGNTSVWSRVYAKANGPAPSTPFSVGASGDRVFVQLNRRDYLNMAEVQVFASAVPEPETYALIVAGLAVVAGAVRRRR